MESGSTQPQIPTHPYYLPDSVYPIQRDAGYPSLRSQLIHTIYPILSQPRLRVLPPLRLHRGQGGDPTPLPQP